MSLAEALPYRSPISKLLRFFCRSRDRWKAKCKEAKRENRSLKYRLIDEGTELAASYHGHYPLSILGTILGYQHGNRALFKHRFLKRISSVVLPFLKFLTSFVDQNDGCQEDDGDGRKKLL